MTAYGQRDAASVLMALGRAVALRNPHGGEPAATLRMTGGAMRRMTWTVDGEARSQAQLDMLAARALSAARAESLATGPAPRRNRPPSPASATKRNER